MSSVVFYRDAPAMTKRLIVAAVLATGVIVAIPFGITSKASEREAAVGAALARACRPLADRSLDLGRKPGAVLGLVHVRPGDRVLDVLASPGYYTELLADLVGPTGTVLAYDPPQFVSRPEARANWGARIRRHPNITQDLQPLHLAQFGDQAFDLALMHLAYHETYWESVRYGLRRMEPRSFVRRLHSALRLGGQVIVVDHLADEGSDPRQSVMAYHRIARSVVVADFEAAGFQLVARSDILRNSEDDLHLNVFDERVRGGLIEWC